MGTASLLKGPKEEENAAQNKLAGRKKLEEEGSTTF